MTIREGFAAGYGLPEVTSRSRIDFCGVARGEVGLPCLIAKQQGLLFEEHIERIAVQSRWD
jgi:hypothetical protein